MPLIYIGDLNHRKSAIKLQFVAALLYVPICYALLILPLLAHPNPLSWKPLLIEGLGLSVALGWPGLLIHAWYDYLFGSKEEERLMRLSLIHLFHVGGLLTILMAIIF